MTVSRGASGVCPTACICATDIVSCTNKNLSRVPGNLFRLIKRLDLSYNRIGLLDSEWIPVSLVKLNTLIIRHNNITSISTDSFSTTPNLKCLDLSSNKLKTVKSAVFQELKVLEVLLLYNNHISYLDPYQVEFGVSHNKLPALYSLSWGKTTLSNSVRLSS